MVAYSPENFTPNGHITDSMVATALLCPELLVNGGEEFDVLRKRRKAPLRPYETQQVLADSFGIIGPIVNYRSLSITGKTADITLHRALHELKANVQSNPNENSGNYRVIAFPEIIDPEAGFFAKPLFIGFTERDGWVPLVAAAIEREKGGTLSLFSSHILNRIGFYSGASIFANKLPGASEWRVDHIDYRGREQRKSPKQRKLDDAIALVESIRSGNYHPAPAFIDLCVKCIFRDRCFDGMSNDLTFIYGLNRIEQQKLNDAGIFDIDGLLAEKAEDICKRFKNGRISRERIENFQRLAGFLRRGVVYQKAAIPTPIAAHQIYWDVETFDKEHGRGNMIKILYHQSAIYVDPDGNKTYLNSTAFGEELSHERAAFLLFWEDLRERTGGFKDTAIYHYGSHDRWTSQALVRRHGIGPEIFPSGRAEVPFIDALPIVQRSLASPWGHSLKTLATIFYGETWTTEIQGQITPLRPGTAKYFFDQANANTGTPLDVLYINELNKYSFKDVWNLYRFMNNFPGASRLERAPGL